LCSSNRRRRDHYSRAENSCGSGQHSSSPYISHGTTSLSVHDECKRAATYS